MLLLFVPPVGIALLWWGKHFTQRTRGVLTAASALLFLVVISTSGKRSARKNADGGEPVSPASPTTASAPSHSQQPAVGGAGRGDPATGKTAEVAPGEAAWERARRSRNGQVAVRHEDFGEEWPLTVEAGTIRCEPPSIVTFSASDGRIFGVNGMGMAHHSQIDPIWADDPSPTGRAAKLKKSIGPLISLGLFLCKQVE